MDTLKINRFNVSKLGTTEKTTQDIDAATQPHRAILLFVICLPTHTDLKGQCHKMNNFFEGFKNQVSTFSKGADGF